MNPHDHTRWLNESDDIDAIRQRQREQEARWNSPEDFDPVAAANHKLADEFVCLVIGRIMADLARALDKALPTTNAATSNASEPSEDQTQRGDSQLQTEDS